MHTHEYAERVNDGSLRGKKNEMYL